MSVDDGRLVLGSSARLLRLAKFLDERKGTTLKPALEAAASASVQ